MDRLESVAHAGPAGWRVAYQPSATSTQDLARAAARAGHPARSAFVTDFQVSGRGRSGRAWLAPPGSSLLVSLLFRAQAPQPRPHSYTRLVSVALAEAIEAVCPARVAIKWPNDLLLDGRKVAGILAEALWEGPRVALVVGAGTNVRASATAALPADAPATSLEAATGRQVDRGDLLLALLSGVDRWAERDDARLQAAWQARLWGRGQRLRLLESDARGEPREQEVVVLGAHADGSLRVRLPDGVERTTLTGELIL